MPKFADMLTKTAEDIQRPLNLPVGYYHGVINKHPQHDENVDAELEFLSFPVKILAPHEDTVDADELEAYGPLKNVLLSKNFIFNVAEGEENNFARTEFQVRSFLESLDIGFGEGKDMSIKEALAECVNCEVIVEVTHRPNKNDPEVFFDNINRISAA